MNVLIVDDDEVDRTNLVRLLSKNQYFNVTAVDDANFVLDGTEGSMFDAVILDYHLPDMSGLELFSQMKGLHSFQDSSVVFVSNNEDDSLAAHCIECGAQDFVLKSDLSESRIKRAIMLARKRRELENYVRKSYTKIKYLAERDTLTGLYNRNSFETELERLCDNQTSIRSFCLVLIDVDGFSSLNQMYGARTGDRVMMETASRIKQFFGEKQFVARTGNDEFALIISSRETLHNLNSCLEALAAELMARINTETVEASCSFSIGVSTKASAGCDYEEVLREARMALDVARQLRNNRAVYFDEALMQSQNRQQLIQKGIEHHLNKGEFQLAFQPVVGREQELLGIEALVRWPDKSQFGYHSPAIFIPEAERTHQVMELGDWVAKTAIHYFSKIREFSSLPMFLSINISPVQLDATDISESLEEYCLQVNVPTTEVILEITESALMKEHMDTTEQLNQLVKRGFRIALDDFGTGYSSLSHLLEFPIDVLKTDRTVLPQSMSDEKRKAIMTAVIQMATSLGVSTVAEGVEEPWQLDFCLTTGVDKMQGFYFCKPLSFERLLEFIAEKN